MHNVVYRRHERSAVPRVVVMALMVLYGCVPPPPHQFVPEGRSGKQDKRCRARARPAMTRCALCWRNRHGTKSILLSESI